MSDDVQLAVRRLSDRGTPRGADVILGAVEEFEYVDAPSKPDVPRPRRALAMVACVAAALLGVAVVAAARRGETAQSVASGGSPAQLSSGAHVLPSTVPADLRLSAVDHWTAAPVAPLLVVGEMGRDGSLEAGIAAMTAPAGTLQALIEPQAPTLAAVGTKAAQVSESDGSPRQVSVLRYTDDHLGAVLLAGRNVRTDDLVRAANGLAGTPTTLSISTDHLPSNFGVLYTGSTNAFALLNNTSTDQLFYRNRDSNGRELTLRSNVGDVDPKALAWVFPDARLVTDGDRTLLYGSLGSGQEVVWSNGSTAISVSATGFSSSELNEIVTSTKPVTDSEWETVTQGLPTSGSGAAATAPGG